MPCCPVLCYVLLCSAAPFSDIYRGMALIGVKGFGALPKYCGVLMLVFFCSGILSLCTDNNIETFQGNQQPRQNLFTC